MIDQSHNRLFWLWLNDYDFPLTDFFLCISAVVAFHSIQSGTFSAENVYCWGDCIIGMRGVDKC